MEVNKKTRPKIRSESKHIPGIHTFYLELFKSSVKGNKLYQCKLSLIKCYSVMKANSWTGKAKSHSTSRHFWF